jgi:RNA polymerase sigma-70 factor, ECF subfamily
MAATEAEQDAAALATYLDPGRAASERQAAFAELVDRHARRLHVVCVRVLGSHADAEEAVQETFVRLARSARDFRGDAALSTWLYRVAHNVCTDLIRYEARRPRTPVADVAEVAEVADDADDHAAAARVELGEVGRALARLDDASRMLLLLVAVDGLSYAEAAEATGMATGTVKSRVSRARVRLGELLRAAGDGEPGARSAPDGVAVREAGRPRRTRGPP